VPIGRPEVGKLGVKTEPGGVPIMPIIPKATISRSITERGGGGDRDRRHYRLTPDYVKAELSRRVNIMERGEVADFETEEFTPISVIAVVRAELKDDIKSVRNDVAAMRSEQGQLIAVVKTSNEMFPKLVDQMMTMIGNELKNRQDLDVTVTETELGIKSHREKTAVDMASFSNRAKWRNVAKIVAFIFSGAGATLILNALTRGC